jgi:hypothetical protein
MLMSDKVEKVVQLIAVAVPINSYKNHQSSLAEEINDLWRHTNQINVGKMTGLGNYNMLPLV